MVRRRSLALVVTAALALGCGPDPEAVPFLRTERCPTGECAADGGVSDAAPEPIVDEPLEDWDEEGAGLLTGIFAVEATIRARVVIEIETRQIFRLRIVQRGRSIKQKVTLCSFKLPVVEDVATLHISPAIIALMRSKVIESEGDFLSSESLLGAEYDPPPALVVVGADLADPKADPLPTEEDTSLAIDEDGDGHPGVTLSADVLTCKNREQLYVALRTSAGLAGVVKTPDLISGEADVALDQSPLGYSDPCMSTVSKINILIEPGSTFRAVRTSAADDIDGNGNVSCPELARRGEALFGEYWAE